MPPDQSDFPRIAVIVLGAAVWAQGQPSPTLLRRALWGARVFMQSGALYLVASGGLGKHPPAEALVIQQICRENGVPLNRILAEVQSHNTRDNIRLSVAALAGKGIDHYILVTDRYHAPRARLIARRMGLSATTSAPAMSGTQRRRVFYAYLREAAALAREYLGLSKP